MVNKDTGYLIIDDTVLDKIFGKNIEPTYSHYSGRHHKSVNGIDVINFIWNGTADVDKAEHIPIDFRVYDIKRDGKTKNDHAHDMLSLAHKRGFNNVTVLADSTYSDQITLKKIKRYHWSFVVNLKSNRQVRLKSSDDYQNVAKLMESMSDNTSVNCFLHNSGLVKILKLRRDQTDDYDYLATNNIQLSSPDIRTVNARRWKIEEFHRGEKQAIKIQGCQFRGHRAQRNHILCSALAFLAIEKHRLEHGFSWYESKSRIIIDSLRKYLREPFMPLPINSLKPRYLGLSKS